MLEKGRQGKEVCLSFQRERKALDGLRRGVEHETFEYSSRYGIAWPLAG